MFYFSNLDEFFLNIFKKMFKYYYIYNDQSIILYNIFQYIIKKLIEKEWK